MHRTGGLDDSKKALALTRFEARVGFVDDVNTSLTLDHFAVAVTRLQCFQRVNDFHDLHSFNLKAGH